MVLRRSCNSCNSCSPVYGISTTHAPHLFLFVHTITVIDLNEIEESFDNRQEYAHLMGLAMENVGLFEPGMVTGEGALDAAVLDEFDMQKDVDSGRLKAVGDPPVVDKVAFKRWCDMHVSAMLEPH